MNGDKIGVLYLPIGYRSGGTTNTNNLYMLTNNFIL